MNKYKILVADDEELVHEYLEEVLAGHELHFAFTLDDEMKKIKSETFDIIIQDIRMPKTLSDGDEEIFGGFNLISKLEENKDIEINKPVVWLISREKKTNVALAVETNRDLTNFRKKENRKEWYENFAKEVLEFMDNIGAQNRFSAKQRYPKVIKVMEKKFLATVDLQKKIIDFINTVENDDWLTEEQFVNGYRRIYKLIIKNLLVKYKPFSKHYVYDKKLNRFEYLKEILNSTLASLYASLIQATNGAEHRESEQESQDEFGFVFDDGAVGQIDNDKFSNYYNKNVFKILCLGLFEFIELADDLLENEGKISEWNQKYSLGDYEIGDLIDVAVYSIKPQLVLVKTISGERGSIHISQISDERIENINNYVEVGEKIKVKLIRKDLQFSIKEAVIQLDADNVDTDV